jgi:predicted nucleic acid-binding protein
LALGKDNKIIADSTFYLCFLEDIGKPEILSNIMDEFDFLITPTVYNEVSHSNRFVSVQNHPKLKLYPKQNLGEALRPFFSQKQIQKGETEVIELAYDFYVSGCPVRIILDDKQPRMFVLRTLPELGALLIGTVGFVGDCYCKYGFFEKAKARTIILLISKSPFRVSADVISEVLTKIESR